MGVSVVRAISAGCFAIVMGALIINPYDPLGVITAFASVCAAVWMFTAPGIALHYLSGFELGFGRPWTRKRTQPNPPVLSKLAKAMNAPLPHQTKLVPIDKPNAATNGTTLFITRGLEPYLEGCEGEAVLAHELAHAKLQHHNKDTLVVMGVGLIAYLFGAQFWEAHAFMGWFMGVLAFLTLGAVVFPFVSRRMEYDADALASTVVGPTSMIGALTTLVPRDKWAKESDSHPSVEARIRSLQSL